MFVRRGFLDIQADIDGEFTGECDQNKIADAQAGHLDLHRFAAGGEIGFLMFAQQSQIGLHAGQLLHDHDVVEILPDVSAVGLVKPVEVVAVFQPVGQVVV